AKELENTAEISLPQSHDTKRYDVFGTANFFNFRPLTASIEYLLNIGMKEIQANNDSLVEMIIEGLKGTDFELLSLAQKDQRSALLVFSHKNPSKNEDIF